MGMVWEAYHKGVPLLGVPEISLDHCLGGVFNYFLFSPLFGEDEPNLTNIFQRG